MPILRIAAFAAVLLLPSAAFANGACQESRFTPLAGDTCKLVIVLPQLQDPGAAPGPKRITVPPREAAFKVGQDFPVYSHSMLLDPPRYGLPPVNGNWRYYRVEGDTYRVDSVSLKVIEVVDTRTARKIR